MSYGRNLGRLARIALGRFDTPTEVRAMTVFGSIVPTQIVTMGGATVGDGGGGVWRWDSSSTATDDTGTILKITSITTGRYIRERDPQFVNVMWFGAARDGSTDDSTEIQAAVDALDSDDGGIVYFPPGRYGVGAEISVNKHAVIFTGSGFPGATPSATKRGSYLLPVASFAGAMIKFTTTASAARFGGGMRYLTMMDDFSSGAGRNYSINAGLELDWHDKFVMQNCHFERLKGSAIKMSKSTKSIITGLAIDQCGDTNKPSLDLDSAATHGSSNSVQGLSLSNANVEVSYNAANIYFGANAVANKLTNVTLENTNISGADGVELVVAGERNVINAFSVNANRGTGRRITVSGKKNSFVGMSMGQIPAGTSKTEALIVIDGGRENNFTSIVTDSADPGLLFDLKNSAIYNTFAGIQLEAHRLCDIDATSTYNMFTDITSVGLPSYLIDCNGAFNGFKGIMVNSTTHTGACINLDAASCRVMDLWIVGGTTLTSGVYVNASNTQVSHCTFSNVGASTNPVLVTASSTDSVVAFLSVPGITTPLSDSGTRTWSEFFMNGNQNGRINRGSNDNLTIDSVVGSDPSVVGVVWKSSGDLQIST